MDYDVQVNNTSSATPQQQESRIAQLEAELAAMTKRAETAEHVAKEWNAVEASWDVQAVGRAIRVPLGGDVRAAILPAIQQLKHERDEAQRKLAIEEQQALDARDTAFRAIRELDGTRSKLCAAQAVLKNTRHSLACTHGLTAYDAATEAGRHEDNHFTITLASDMQAIDACLAMPTPCPHEQKAAELAAALVELQRAYREDEAVMVEYGHSKRPDTTDYAAEAAKILGRVISDMQAKMRTVAVALETSGALELLQGVAGTITQQGQVARGVAIEEAAQHLLALAYSMPTSKPGEGHG